MQYKLGIFIGFIFGLIAPFLVALGLISPTVELLSPVLYAVFTPPIFLANLLSLNARPAIFPITVLLNAVLFAFIGYLIQKLLRKRRRDEKIVFYAFLTVVILFILLVLIDVIIGRAGA